MRTQLAQRLRFDGLWWRQFARLGCVYGPEWWKRSSPPVIAAILFACIGRNRRGAIANQTRVLGRDGWPARAAALQMFATFAHCMTETMEYYGPRPQPMRVDPPGNDSLVAELKGGRGAIIVTGHFGNWDIGAKALHELGRPINVVMAREANASTQEYVRRVREEVGVRVLFSDTSVFSSLNIVRALRNNEVVALQLDRTTAAGGTRLVPFFGAPAPFPVGPFVLARISGAPLFPVFVPRLGVRHYAIRIGGRFSVPRDTADPQASLDRVMREVVGVFEAALREYPTQWFQFAPFWPADTPPTDTAIVPELPSESVSADADVAGRSGRRRS